MAARKPTGWMLDARVGAKLSDSFDECEGIHSVRKLDGVSPRALSSMPRRCKCGRPLKYAEQLEFHPAHAFVVRRSCFFSVGFDSDGDSVLDQSSVWSDDIYKGPCVVVHRDDTAEHVRSAVLVAVVMSR